MKALKHFWLFYFVAGIIPALHAQTSTLTVGQVYNFEVGDTFIYSQNWDGDYPITYSRWVLLSKSTSVNNDTVDYEFEVHSFTNYGGPPPIYPFNHGVSHVIKYDLQSLIGQTMDSTDPHGGNDTLLSRVDSIYTLGGLAVAYSRFRFSGGCVAEQSLGQGLGEVLDYWICPIDAWDRHLIYYHKANGASGGTFYEVPVDINSPLAESNFFIYYDEASGQLIYKNHEQPNIPLRLQLFDMRGRLLMDEAVNSNSGSFAVKTLSTGAYLWQVYSKEVPRTQGKLLVR